jgi:hypothetical protein
MKNEYECRHGEPRQGRGQAVPKEPQSSAIDLNGIKGFALVDCINACFSGDLSAIVSIAPSLRRLDVQVSALRAVLMQFSAKAAAISTAETHVCALMQELKDIADALHAVHAVAEFSLRKGAR